MPDLGEDSRFRPKRDLFRLQESPIVKDNRSLKKLHGSVSIHKNNAGGPKLDQACLTGLATKIDLNFPSYFL